jgi:glutaredoxin-like protein NrdH
MMNKIVTNASTVIYTKENCQQCSQSKALLKKLNIPFSEISVEDNPDVLQFLRSEGFMAAPVIITDEESWSGFQPAKIHGILTHDGSVETEDDDWSF